MNFSSNIDQHRLSIDLLDRTLLDLLAERCRLVRQNSDCAELRNEIWVAMGHYSEGAGRGLSRNFMAKLGRILDQTARIDIASPLLGLEPNDLLGSMEVFDKAILLVLSERFKVVLRIGKIKRSQDIQPLDPRRWTALLNEREARGESLGIPKALIVKLFELIHEFALEIESKVEI